MDDTVTILRATWGRLALPFGSRRFSHGDKCCSQHAVRARQVDIEHGLPLLVAHPVEHAVPRIARAGCDKVYAAELLLCRTNEVLAHSLIRHRACDRRRVLHAGGGFCERALVEVVQHEPRTVRGERLSEAASDAPARTCDDCDFACNAFHMRAILAPTHIAGWALPHPPLPARINPTPTDARSDSMAQSYEGIDSGMFADALDILKCDGAMVGLQPLSHGQKFWGRALTVRMLVGTAGTFNADEIALGQILAKASKDDVIVIDVDGEYITVWGELAAMAAQNLGVSGLIVDGAVRDADIMRKLGFPVLTRHICPTAGQDAPAPRLGSGRSPSRSGAFSVHPGDFVFADETGAVVVPQDLYEQTLDEVDKIKQKEDAFKEGLKQGLPYLEAAKGMGLKQI